MEFLKRKAEELRKKGVGRVQGTHPIPGTKPRRVRDDNPAHKKLKLLEEEEKAKEDEDVDCLFIIMSVSFSSVSFCSLVLG